jgi:hypothetical protein
MPIRRSLVLCICCFQPLPPARSGLVSPCSQRPY